MTLFFFFLLIWRPPGFTLFPYTTLFRSVSAPLAGHHCRFPSCSDLAAISEQLGKDRKSTRLNSSHVSISYAVFCLKKKTSLIVMNNCMLDATLHLTIR